MNVNLEALEEIPKIYELVKQLSEQIENKIEKRWLSTEDTALYLGYSKDSIDAMVKKGEFIPGIHYHQKARKRMFDKNILDKWVVGIDLIDTNFEAQFSNTIKEINSSLAA